MLRRVRLVSGLILFTYISLHLTPVILGNISLTLMEWARPHFHGVWDARVGQIILYGALLTHAALAFQALYERRNWRQIRPMEAIQALSGFLIPVLLCLHVISTRMADELYGLNPTYPWIMAIYFEFDTASGWRQAAVMAIAWTHGCIGIFYWLRLKPWWPRVRPYLFALAILWPSLATTGFIGAGQEAADMVQNETWLRRTMEEAGTLDTGQLSTLYGIQTGVFVALAGLLTLTFAMRGVRNYRESHAGSVCARYEDGTVVRFNHGMTLLDASRSVGYPHASVCGGRGRCSTCRVRIRLGLELLPEPSESERKVLARFSAGKNIRLACQCIPEPGTIELTPLLPAHATVQDAYGKPDYTQGRELPIAVLFADLRGFTSLSEDRLPYDTVFILNRYFDAMGQAVDDAGGHLDKFIGDGTMALFGLGSTPEEGCRAALYAAKRMAERLAELNAGLGDDLDQPLRVGIGIHVGTTIVGEMGYKRATQLTAIGDVVNIASRLEQLTKTYDCELVISRDVARMARIDDKGFDTHETPVRGRTRPLTILTVTSARSLQIPGRTED